MWREVGIARDFEGLARQAYDGHWPHEEYLQEVLGAELAPRCESVIRQGLREARFCLIFAPPKGSREHAAKLLRGPHRRGMLGYAYTTRAGSAVVSCKSGALAPGRASG